MANFHLGLDFGTSQSKVCLLNTVSEEREFIVFKNSSFYLPTLITQTKQNKFVYGDEQALGIKYRYFKMAAAEDDDLIQVTKENFRGDKLTSKQIDDFRRYNESYDIKPEVLSILYLTYVLLFVKNEKDVKRAAKITSGGLMGRFAKEKNEVEKTFSIKMGIPTEWHNPKHLKRKIKFETILIVVTELSQNFKSLKEFLNADSKSLIELAAKINRKHSVNIENKNISERKEYIVNLLNGYELSVFPETAGGLYYLLQTKRLTPELSPDGKELSRSEKTRFFATLDIGAGTSDISILKVVENKLDNYLCSESVEIASNNVYSEYADQMWNRSTYSDIKDAEYNYRKNDFDKGKFDLALSVVKQQLEKVIRKIYFRNHYIPLRAVNDHYANKIREDLSNAEIIIYGGGAYFNKINQGHYMYFQNTVNPLKQDINRFFTITGVQKFIDQVDIKDAEKVKKEINLLVLALGLSYLPDSADESFFLDESTVNPITHFSSDKEKYFYYDIQDAVYK